jgi:hypothetical protein
MSHVGQNFRAENCFLARESYLYLASPEVPDRGVLPCLGASFAINKQEQADASRLYLTRESHPEVVHMSQSPWRFNPREIKRSISAVQSTGLHVRNVEITQDGTIRVHVGEPEKPGDAVETSEDLRKLL